MFLKDVLFCIVCYSLDKDTIQTLFFKFCFLKYTFEIYHIKLTVTSKYWVLSMNIRPLFHKKSAVAIHYLQKHILMHCGLNFW